MLIDLRVNVRIDADFLALLHQKLFVDDVGNQLALFRLHFGGRLLARLFFLFDERINRAVHLAPHARERDNAVVDLRDDFIDNFQIGFLRPHA